MFTPLHFYRIEHLMADTKRPTLSLPRKADGEKPSTTGRTRAPIRGSHQPRAPKPAKPQGEKRFADRGDFERRPRRENGEDRPRRSFDDRPKRDFGDRSGERPRRDFGDSPRRDFRDGPRRDFGDRPPRRDDDRRDGPRFERQDRPRFDRGEDRPARRFEGSRDANDRQRRDAPRNFDERGPRRDFRSDDRPDYRSGSRPDFRSDSRSDSRGPSRGDSRSDSRSNFRSDFRPDSRPDGRSERRFRDDEPRRGFGRNTDERHHREDGDRRDSRSQPHGYDRDRNSPEESRRFSNRDEQPRRNERSFGERPSRYSDERPARPYGEQRRFQEDRPRREFSERRDNPERRGFSDRQDYHSRIDAEGTTSAPRGNSFSRTRNSSDRMDAPRTDRPAYQSRSENKPEIVDQEGAMRLSKRMAELGLCSRREADEYIERGLVTVDGVVVDELGSKVMPDQKIELSRVAEDIQMRRITILINKPIGYVSGQAEDGYEPASVLITPENHWEEDPTKRRFESWIIRKLAPAGRLDIDSTGLLVLTQDGRIAKHLIGESSMVEKEYLVRVEGRLIPDGLKMLNHGLELDGYELLPAKVSWQNEDQLRFVLREGRKRQIRRMCEMVGLKVVGLKRIRIGSVKLSKLPVGKWRYLAEGEEF